MPLKVNENYIGLKLFGFECGFEEISDQLALTPTGTARKCLPKSERPADKRIWSSNVWLYECVIKSNDFIGDHITKFIDDIIIPKRDVIQELSKTCEIEFSIVQYMHYGCNPGFCLNNSQLRIFAEIGAELNIDIYCLWDNVTHPE